MRGPALLFCPADRPDRYAKALTAADTVIIDLEDAVSPDRKALGRLALLDHPLDPARTIVRVNPAGTPDHELDVEAVRRAGYPVVMLAKTETPDQPASLAGLDVVALCETARGVVNAAGIARVANVTALMWGAEDLLASLGGLASRHADGRYRDVARHARATVLLAAGAAGRAAVDAVHVDLDDLDGLTLEATDAVASGFVATACVHPSQAAVIRQAYAPTEDQVAWARQVLDAAAGGGVVRVAGRMVDAPLVRQAEQVIARRLTA